MGGNLQRCSNVTIVRQRHQSRKKHFNLHLDCMIKGLDSISHLYFHIHILLIDEEKNGHAASDKLLYAL